MNLTVSKIFRDFLLIHLIFVVLCFVILLLPLYMGIKLFILVVIYNVLIPIFGYLRHYTEWVNIWLFTFLLSLFQLWPDWFLSAELGVLVFPEDGFIKIGTVSLYMIGLWTIPLFLILFIGKLSQERYNSLSTYLIIGFLSLLIFGLAEQTLWMLQSWYAENVFIIGHIALYIIIPEIFLGLTTFYGYKLIQDKSHFLKIPITFTIMLLYLGSATFFYFLIEGILLP